MGDYSLLAEELGRTQTVKDVRQAYLRIFEAKRQLVVSLKPDRQSRSRVAATPIIPTYSLDFIAYSIA